MSIFESIQQYEPRQGAALVKHLTAAGIDPDNLTRAALLSFRDHVRAKLSPGAGRTLCASLAALLRRIEHPAAVYCGEALKIRPDRVNRAAITPGELERLEALNDPNELNESTPERLAERPHTRTTGRTSLTPNERFVLNEFIVGCRTGARISDLELFTPANIQDGRLTYTSLKTGITATIPVSDMTIQRVKWLNECGIRLPLMTYNRIIKRLCERAGINEVVTVHQRGKDMTGPKYEFVSSHTARITMCTILANLGVPALDIMRLAGHTDPAMTARYIVRTAPDLNDLAMNYLNK